MPRKSKLNLPPLNLGKETVGQRIARLRKEKGLSQAELAEKMGLTPGLVSDYERDRLRPHPEMIARLALALGISADELIGLKPGKTGGYRPSLKLIRRMREIENLPLSQQKFVLRTIDTVLDGIKIKTLRVQKKGG